ncbi:hypothetical protein WME88_45235 [Sorangium sp. So ce216]
MTTQPPADGPIDFAILTAIEVERRAICAAFGLTDDDRVFLGARVYWRGKLPLKAEEAYEIVVAQALDMASVDAAILTNDTLRDWKPGAALLVGIAASTDEKVRLGDVVAGSEVYYYERGKVTGKRRSKPEPKIIPADSTLWSRVTSVRGWDGAVAADRPDQSEVRPMLHYGVIASGEKVIANATARDQIAAKHRKILAIEMESYGFSRAAWQSFERVRYLSIRSICDDGSSAKNDDWHGYAAAAAAEFAKHFLLDRPLDPRSGQTRGPLGTAPLPVGGGAPPAPRPEAHTAPAVPGAVAGHRNAQMEPRERISKLTEEHERARGAATGRPPSSVPSPTDGHPHHATLARLVALARDGVCGVYEITAPPGSRKTLLLKDLSVAVRERRSLIIDCALVPLVLPPGSTPAFFEWLAQELRERGLTPRSKAPEDLKRAIGARPLLLLIDGHDHYFRLPAGAGRDAFEEQRNAFRNFVKAISRSPGHTMVVMAGMLPHAHYFRTPGSNGSVLPINLLSKDVVMGDAWEAWTAAAVHASDIDEVLVEDVRACAGRQPEAFITGLSGLPDLASALEALENYHRWVGREIRDRSPPCCLDVLDAVARGAPPPVDRHGCVRALAEAGILEAGGAPVVAIWGETWKDV